MDTIRRLFKDEKFNDRCHLGILHKLQGDLSESIVLGNGDLWQEHRQFSVQALRTFGFGKPGGEERIQQEAKFLVAKLREQQEQRGTGFEPELTLATSVANVISFMLFSVRVDRVDDQRFSQFADNVTKNIMELTSDVELEIWPWLRFIYPPFARKFRDIQERLSQTQDSMRQLIAEHKETFDPNHPRDYVDAYFCEQEIRRNASGNEGTFTDEQLIRNLSDLCRWF
ncbi:hypothetical protein RvY_18769-1 [Ramazzottius varieornatus]|uniref:Cytochrome P450 n=1 Tax=Ramazzottius varieornatus TaxID=947166 RepID=A0A1D1W716_RAMVA|nr:hypothetical protein RvY_18769-1 [Ramazzottius varieornatus]